MDLSIIKILALRMLDSVKKNNRAFTFVELLLAMAITSIVILTAVTVLRNSQKLYSYAITENQNSYELQMLASVLRNELSFAYIPKPSTETDNTAIFSLTGGTSSKQFKLTFFTLCPSFSSSPGSSLPEKITYTFTKADSDIWQITRTSLYAAGSEIISSPEQLTDETGFKDINCSVFVKETDSSDIKWQGDYSSEKNLPAVVKFMFKYTNNRENNILFYINCNASASVEN